MSLLAIAVVLICGVWCGFACEKGWRSAFKLSAFAVVWIGIALVLLAVCDRVTLLDMLLLRYVGDDSCLFGGFETR